MHTHPELLAPAGGFDAALAAFQYGADAVYLGLPRFSARADADNFTPDRLRVLLAYARTFTPAKKVYVTLNTLICDPEINEMLESLATLAELAPDGVIVQDLGVARLIREYFPSLRLHASTQLAAHNLDGVLALKELGFTRVVLARELTCQEIRHIVQESGVAIEIFVHGALCYSYSGLCLFSALTAGRSGNRGRCAYCCREGFWAETGGGCTPVRYAFSMKDLALAPMLFYTVTATGVHALKIEGRMKSPLYVACVTDYYRRKLDGNLTPADEQKCTEDLQTVFSRPWTTLYASARNLELPKFKNASPIDPIAVGHRGAHIGHAEAVSPPFGGIRWLRLTTSRALEKYDGLQIELPNAGRGRPFGFPVKLLRAPGSGNPVFAAPAGTTVEVALPPGNFPPIPPGSPVFCSASQEVRRSHPIKSIRENALRAGCPVDFAISLLPTGMTVTATAQSPWNATVSADTFLSCELTPSRHPGQTAAAVRKAFDRLGDTTWRLGTLTLHDPEHCYARPSCLNEVRRDALTALASAWEQHRDAYLQHIRDTYVALPSYSPAPTYTWTLKMRPAPPSSDTLDFDVVILAIGHTPYAELALTLAQWAARRPRLALPLISHDPERAALRKTAARLIADGWTDWECADLAGYHLLRTLGVTPASSDWSLYATNRISTVELTRMGIQSFVLSPELDFPLIHSLADTTPVPELIVYQHTPHFISETAPHFPEIETMPQRLTLYGHRNRTFITHRLDSRWVTVTQEPLRLTGYLDKTSCTRFRVDLSWSPDPLDNAWRSAIARWL